MLTNLKKELACTLSLIFILAALTSCAKKPETPVSPSVKVSVEKKAEDKIYAVNFTCGLKNENDSTVFSNVDGVFAVKDKSGVTVLSVPFKIPAILPFETGVIQEKIGMKPEQASALFTLLSIDKDKIESGEEHGSRSIEDKNIVIQKLNMQNVDIIEFLRSKRR